MSLRINTNVDALTAYQKLQSTGTSLSTSLERLSSGLRINKAADDAAGLAISQGLTSSINGIGQAIRNAQDGINVIQTADGALTEVSTMLQRMRTLLVQAANGANNSTSINSIGKEITQLQNEIDRISSSTDFNGVKLLDGSFTGKWFQVSANSGTDQNIQIAINVTFTAAGLGIGSTAISLSGLAPSLAWDTISGTGGTGGTAYLNLLTSAITTVSDARADLGAYQNRFQHTINNLSVTQVNLSSSNSSIIDADMATEMSNFTRTQILQSAGTSMLRQANLSAQSVLSLLQ